MPVQVDAHRQKVTHILDDHWHVGKVLRAIVELWKLGPFDANGFVEADDLAGSPGQMKLVCQFAIDGGGRGAGVEEELETMEIADAALNDDKVACV